jgi:hypothetical protein
VRVYLPTTRSGLRAALAADQVDAPVGYAVTPTLREWYAEGNQEELEYAASTAAARASLRLLTGGDDDWRRVVLAAELPDAEARPAPEVHRAAVRLAGPVPWRVVESALVDDGSAGPDVRRGADALPAADAGDDDATFLVDAVEDHELGWYALQELDDLLGGPA